MNGKSFIYCLMIMAMVLAVAGCETVPKKFRAEVSGIKSRVETLETKVESVEAKASETERLAGEQAQTIEELKAAKERALATAARTNVEVKHRTVSRPKASVREIQACLKNAGFYHGSIDGVKGKNTRKAIRAFQEANGLTRDGIVGKRTWEALSKYASASAGGGPEGADEAATTK